MANVFRKSYKKDGRGILRPTRKKIPVADRRGVNRAGHRNARLDILKNRSKPVATLAHVPKDGQVKICIQRKLGGIGDVIMTTPLAEAFKQQYPNCEFTYATQPGVLSNILEGNPFIDKVVDFNTVDQQDYHMFADVTSTGLAYEKSTNPPKNRIDMFAEYVGIRLTNYKPTYVVSDKETVWAKAILDKWFGDKKGFKLVYLDISSIDQRRSWPAEHNVKFVGEVNALRNDVRFIVNDFNRRLGRNWDYEHCIDISSYGVRESAALLKECDLFVGPDSGMLHIAGALEKSIVGIFGSTPAAARINHYQNAIAVEASISCSPCWYKPCHINFACMSGIKPQQVRDAVLAKLDDYKTITESLLTTPINIMTVTPTDHETNLVAMSLKAGLGTMGLNASLNSPTASSDSITFEVIKTSLINNINYPTTPTGKLKVGYLLVEESQLSREAVKRLVNSYDLLLTNSRNAMQVITSSGVLQPAYNIGTPLFRGTSLTRPSTTSMTIGVVASSKRSNLDTILAVFTQLRETYADLKLRVLSFKDLQMDVPGVEVISTYPENHGEYNKFWHGLNVFMDCTDNSSGIYLKDAMLRGVPVLGMLNSFTREIPDGLFYGMVGKPVDHVFYEELGMRLGSGTTVDKEELSFALSDTIQSYQDQVQLVSGARDWVLRNSSYAQLNMLANFLAQKIVNTR